MKNTVKTQQIDIFGNKQENKSLYYIAKELTYFPKISLENGLDSLQMQYDYMLIHRIIQKRLYKDLSQNINKFLKIFENELAIKAGQQDIASLTRDTLLEYFLK